MVLFHYPRCCRAIARASHPRCMPEVCTGRVIGPALFKVVSMMHIKFTLMFHLPCLTLAAWWATTVVHGGSSSSSSPATWISPTASVANWGSLSSTSCSASVSTSPSSTSSSPSCTSAVNWVSSFSLRSASYHDHGRGLVEGEWKIRGT
jgi:hypothetical protein